MYMILIIVGVVVKLKLAANSTQQQQQQQQQQPRLYSTLPLSLFWTKQHPFLSSQSRHFSHATSVATLECSLHQTAACRLQTQAHRFQAAGMKCF